MENKQLPKITASNADQFKKIDELLKQLPECVYDQIEVAQSGAVGLECIIRQTFRNENRIWLPKCTTQIQDFGEYTGIYAGSYFIKIVGKMYSDSTVNYVFYEEKK